MSNLQTKNETIQESTQNTQEQDDFEWVNPKTTKLQELTEYIQEQNAKGELIGYNFSLEPSATASIEDYAGSVLNLLKSPVKIDVTAYLEAGGEI